MMMYPAMTNVRLDQVGAAFRSPRQLGVVVIFNYLVAPFVMFALATLLVPDPELRTGLILYGLAPCIAMVIIFTYIAKGNTPMALVFVALNSVIQMLLIPVYARLLIGDVSFDVMVVFESVVLYLGLPLVLGVLTRMLVVRRGGEAAMDDLKPILNGVSILGLLFTLIVMFALKGDLILERPQIVLEMAIPMTIFFGFMFFLALIIGSRLRFPYGDGVAVAFNATGRDFEIAIAIAITAFSPTVALATVVGPLIEVPVMLFLVWAAMRLRPRLFPDPECVRYGHVHGGRTCSLTRVPARASTWPPRTSPTRPASPRCSPTERAPASWRCCATGPTACARWLRRSGSARTTSATTSRSSATRASCAPAATAADARWVYYERDEEAIARAAATLQELLR